MAPRPKPNALKAKPPSSKARAEEPKPATGAPEPDADLSPEARAAWGDVVARLAGTGVITQAERPLLRLYATTAADLAGAEADLREHGAIMRVGKQGYLQLSPYATLVRDLRRQLKAILTELGLTPSARSKLKAAPVDHGLDWRELLDREDRA